MKCRMCGRVLFRDATSGLQMGPKCAKAHGLLPPPTRRRARFVDPDRPVFIDPRQVDWVNSLAQPQAPPP